MIDARLMRATALVALAAGAPAVGSLRAQVPARVRDTVFLRTQSPEMRAKLDSVDVLFRALTRETPMSPEFTRIRKELEAVTAALSAQHELVDPMDGPRVRVMLQAPEGPHLGDDLPSRAAMLPVRVRGWIGLNTGFAPFTDTVRDGDYLVRYFEHPSIISVEPNSPAEQAGIAPGDVLLAYDGQDVVGRWVDVTRMLEPEKKLMVRVAREGDAKTYALTVARVPGMIRARRAAPAVRLFGQEPEQAVIVAGGQGGGIALPAPVRIATMGGFGGMFAARGLFGASLTSVGDALAKALGIPTGLLVNEVPEPTPAYRAGLRTGDVIVKADGEHVASTNDLLKTVVRHANDRSVPLEIVRNHKTKKLTLEW